MNFTFPDNKTIQSGKIQNFSFNTAGRIVYTDIDIQNYLDNIIEINGVDYCFTYLQGAISGNKGGNSILLNLYDAQSIDSNNLEYDRPDLVLKISKFKKAFRADWIKKNEKRFNSEVKALLDCKKEKFQNVINVYHHGVCKIFNCINERFDEYLYYTMEYAQSDLKRYIEENHNNLRTYEKLGFCISLCEGIKELYTLKYYHRDIKPDNIFMVDNGWKIGDLGLIDDRKLIQTIDDVAEFIGPRGWLSPEAMNKYLCEGKNFNYSHDCVIDHQSDIFQLGKVFWYIFQHNAPVGEVKEGDFYIKNPTIFSVLKTMLRYSKKSRYKKIEEVITILKKIQQDLLVKAA